jgi:hydroxymethylpyrimidine pyrophosphatase-like HAD family hydrolase
MREHMFEERDHPRTRVTRLDPARFKRTYVEELAAIDRAYAAANRADISALSETVTRLTQRPALFVASGGAMVPARLAADLHITVARQLSRAMTPLEFAALPPLPVGTLLVSARARHPDVLLGARAAAAAGHDPIGLLTLRSAQELPASIADSGVSVLTIPAFPGREGFLATTSIVTLTVTLARAYLGATVRLPRALRDVLKPLREPLRPHLLVLISPGTEAAAVDLETRFHELGLRTVQLADFRNFAHGRHFGLARRLDQTSIVALVTAGWASLADATLKLLPREAHVVRLESGADWPASTIELIRASMQLVASAAYGTGIEPAVPSVRPFGRSLYHLSAVRRVVVRHSTPVDRKLTASGMSHLEPVPRRLYESALRRVLDRLHDSRYAGVVLDYDGTCCTTEGRFALPSAEVQEEVIRLLRGGIALGFASGRGGSLTRDLRQWIPREYWPGLHLGLYNGGVVLTLAEDLADQTNAAGDIRRAMERLQSGPFGKSLKFELRATQLGVSAPHLAIDTVIRIATESLAQPPTLHLRVVASAHAVDIVLASSSKAAVLSRMTDSLQNAQVLAIGDQGQAGGNDFELLAATQDSLSVDRCSADPTRCWNLDTKGNRGPVLLVDYLRSLKTNRGRVGRFVLKLD